MITRWFQVISYVHPYLARIPILANICKWLVQPPPKLTPRHPFFVFDKNLGWEDYLRQGLIVKKLPLSSKYLMSTWNPNVPCFDWKRPYFGGQTKDKWVPGRCLNTQTPPF